MMTAYYDDDKAKKILEKIFSLLPGETDNVKAFPDLLEELLHVGALDRCEAPAASVDHSVVFRV